MNFQLIDICATGVHDGNSALLLTATTAARLALPEALLILHHINIRSLSDGVSMVPSVLMDFIRFCQVDH